MRREILSIAAMAGILVASQAVAIGLSSLFNANNFRAFENPSDPTNTLVYVIMILAFTGVVLGLVRYRRRDVAKYVIMGSIFVTLAFILFIPLAYALFYVTGGALDGDPLYYVSFLVSFAVATLLVYALVKFPEWYVIDTIGFVTAAGVTAILGISFGLLPAILLLLALAVYDAWAVYRTKHMITLADELTTQRLPILLVIPKKAGYSFRQQKSLKEQLDSGEEREAMFVGLGDLIIPGILSVSAFTFLNPANGSGLNASGLSLGPLAPYALVAVGTVLGSLAGFLALMRFVLKGNPQAGLPLLNGGALVGFVITNFLVYGTVHIL
jgi:presenilin-like A22 family membrane protease